MMVPFFAILIADCIGKFSCWWGLIYPIQEKNPEILFEIKVYPLVCSSRDKFPEYIAKVVFQYKEIYDRSQLTLVIKSRKRFE